METFEKIQVVKEIVKDYFDKNAGSAIGWLTLEKLSEDEKNHIIQIGTSILCTKWEIGYEGGGFVQAVVNNDLREAIGRADGINIKALKLYCQMMYNLGMPNFN